MTGIRAIRTGFTLIELLVVVAIVALLLAILLPSLRAARLTAKRVKCAANQKQLVTAWDMYLNDHADRFLKGRETDNLQWNYGGRQGRDSAYRGMAKPLNKYVGAADGDVQVDVNNEVTGAADLPDLFRCPSDQGGWVIQPTHSAYYGTSYSMNHLLVGPTRLRTQGNPIAPALIEASRRLPGMQRSDVDVDSSRLIVLADGGWYLTQHYGFGPETKAEWHEKPCAHNVAFMDGHVAFIRLKKGIWVDSDYLLMPFKSLLASVIENQQELDCE